MTSLECLKYQSLQGANNMKLARLTGLMLVAIFAMSLIAASAAMAGAPEFKPTGASITGTSGTAILSANSGAETVTCEKDSTTGTVSSATLAGNILVHFLGCTSTGTGGSNCAVNSPGGGEGLILTNTLHGILGLVLPSKTI
ncbi:MAG: hypothetical protein ABR992_01670, partial [Solirubrobacteraceae bacterium]